ncbi:MAG: glycosyltransferase [Methanobrevibacter sp.]|nr:glycosyltransferase [Methanobrevibacter sp.]
MAYSKTEEIRQQNPGKIICFAVGRHVPYKGLKYLIEASKYLDDRFRIFIGGKGPLTEELKAQAADDSKITFLGRVSDADLIAWYQAMDIFCFPSITKNEAFGIALAEAMYFGKPAVTFTILGSGVNYVCRNGEDGIEVPNRDVKAYADALKKLADDPTLRTEMGGAGKKRVMENFLYSQFRKGILTEIQ